MSSSVPSLVCLALLAAPAAVALDLCEPGTEVRRAVADALAAIPRDAPFEERLAPLRALREKFASDLFVHLAYQDEVFEHGIEGHLKEMLGEYLALAAQHEGDALYLYLAGRAFEGRGTRRAIAIMEQVLALDPAFAPAHRTLAEIHGSNAFRDPHKRDSARAKYEAACPGSAIARKPSPLPPHSTFFARLREDELTPAQEQSIPAEVHRALQQDEWRALRIRLFDWYSGEEQRQALHGLQAEYWQAWRVLVRHFRRTGQHENAAGLLAEMEERLLRLQTSRRATTFRLAAGIVLALHAEAGERDEARALLERMRKSLEDRPDRKRAAELERLRASADHLWSRSRTGQ
jgi:hypothetical protein